MVVRTPVVPEASDAVETVAAVADFIRGFPALEYYELLPYHPLGSAKYRSLGMEYALEGTRRPSADRLEALAREAGRRGIAVRVAGVAGVTQT
jgi:pyruvate formate lyase activating enzyme